MHVSFISVYQELLFILYQALPRDFLTGLASLVCEKIRDISSFHIQGAEWEEHERPV